MEKYLNAAPVCEPNEKSLLRLKSDLNPLWANRLISFFAKTLPGKEEITQEEWNAVKAGLAVYDAWLKRKNTDCLDTLPVDRLKYFKKVKNSSTFAAIS